MPKAKKNETVMLITKLPVPDYILGLDMSLNHTGYCLYNVATGEKKQGLIEPGDKIKGMERLKFIRDHVVEMAIFRKTPADIIARNNRPVGENSLWKGNANCLIMIEHYAFGARGAAMISLGELGGVIRLALYESKIPYIEVPPTLAKKFVTGKGNSNKNVVLLEMYKRFGEDLSDDNVADATGMMYLGRAAVGLEEKPLLAFQKDALTELLKMHAKAHPSPFELENAA